MVRNPGIGNNRGSAVPELVSLDNLVTPVWVYDISDFSIYWANQRALALWESDDLQELTSRDFKPETSQAVHQTLLSYLEQFERGETISRWWRLSPGGVLKDVFCQFSGVRLPDGRMAMLCEGLEMDISKSDAFMSNAIIAATYDKNMCLVSANPTFKECFGEDVTALSGVVVHIDDVEKLIDCVNKEGEATLDILANTLAGQRWHSVNIRSFKQNGQDESFLITQSDIHQRKQRELRHAQQAATDALTGLCNRYAFESRVKRLINQKICFTLFYIDLDGFKPINDTYGHNVGDVILRGVAKRLSSGAFNKAELCRLGGDEFVMTIPADEMVESAEHIAMRIIRALSQPFEVTQQLSLSISASVGIAHYPEHGITHETLLASADAAMYTAKQRGRRRYVHYTPGMELNLQRKMLLAQALPLAIENRELSVHYQPIVNIETGQVEIVEGLVRWDSHALGEIDAEETVASAEEIGLIALIESWVVNQACKDLKEIRGVLGEQVRMSINISGLHLMEPEFISTLNRAVSMHGLTPDNLIIELTEGTLIPATEHQNGAAHRLKFQGYHIAIDDFGTGYSSLAYLHHFPASYVKVDKAFIDHMLEDVATVSCINRLVSTLGMVTIAEGVEQKAQTDLLKQQDVCLQQGFLFSRPMPVEKLTTYSSMFGKPCHWAPQ